MFSIKRNFIALFLFLNIFASCSQINAMDGAAGSMPRPATNYCKEILDGIQTNNLEQINTALRDFFEKIPYDLQSIGNEHANKGLYKSIFYALCLTLRECANKINFGNGPVIAEDDNDLIYLPLKYENNIFIFQFIFTTYEDDNPRLYSYFSANEEDQITVFGLHFFANKLISDKSPERIYAVNEHPLRNPKLRYTENFKGRTLKSVFPIELHEDTEHPSLYNENNCYQQAISYITYGHSVEYLDHVFNNFYNIIPGPWVTHREKFYQILLFCVLALTNYGEVMAEVPTSKGRIDILLKPQIGNSIIFELKKDQSALVALTQIRTKDYPSTINADVDTVGTNFRQNRDSGIITVTSRHELSIYKQAALVPFTPTPPHQGPRRRDSQQPPTQSPPQTAAEAMDLS